MSMPFRCLGNDQIRETQAAEASVLQSLKGNATRSATTTAQTRRDGMK